MNTWDYRCRQYQCGDCGEVPIRDGVCPHGCENKTEEQKKQEGED